MPSHPGYKLLALYIEIQRTRGHLCCELGRDPCRLPATATAQLSAPGASYTGVDLQRSSGIATREVKQGRVAAQIWSVPFAWRTLRGSRGAVNHATHSISALASPPRTRSIHGRPPARMAAGNKIRHTSSACVARFMAVAKVKARRLSPLPAKSALWQEEEKKHETSRANFGLHL